MFSHFYFFDLNVGLGDCLVVKLHVQHIYISTSDASFLPIMHFVQVSLLIGD